jgi:hypothetical protein
MVRALVLLAFCPLRAWAQPPAAPPSAAEITVSLDDVRKTYHIHTGPFYAKPLVLLRELGVDTNVFNTATNPKSDFTFTIGPQVSVAVPMVRRALFTTTGEVDFVYYAKYSTQRSVNPQGIGRFEFYTQRITLFAEESYVNTRQRANYEIDLRSRHLLNFFTGGASVRITSKTSLEVAGKTGKTVFAADDFVLGNSLKQTLDHTTSGALLTARHRLTSLTTIALKSDRIHDTFPLSPIRDNDSYRIVPGVEFKPRALISGFVYLGYRSFAPRNPALPKYNGLVSQIGLSYTMLGATTFSVIADRDVEYSFEASTPYFLDNRFGVFIRRAVGGNWDILGNAIRHEYNYRRIAATAPEAADPRVDVTDNYGVNLGYRLKRQTRLGVGASYYSRSSSEVPFRNYEGVRLGTTVTYGF